MCSGSRQRRRRQPAPRRTFVLPAQPAALALVNERDSRRKQILDAIIHSGHVSALAFYGTGRDNDIRSESLRRIVQPLLDRGVARLIIESRQRRDDLNRQVLIDHLCLHGAGGFDYARLPPCRPAAVDRGRTPMVLFSRRALARSIATITSGQDVTGW